MVSAEHVVWVAAIVFTAASVVGPGVIEVLRMIVHHRRAQRDGLGGTQDVAMWGTFALWGGIVLAVGLWGVWLALR
ncbi:MAG: hypothetical protein RMJ56_03320 [Gemmataceae bacterium]|nr:hypothetical protein [Gemmata sp.]MDW8196619.1 hypothetical protein [Gemmataceae bacterium]